MDIAVRIASLEDLPAVMGIIARAVSDLQRGFLSPAEVEASRQFMGVDTQLLRDQTYFCATLEGRIIGCGGWSWRRTLFGGDSAHDLIDPAPLDPCCEPARIRAMYTDPPFVRRGVGMAILAAAEDAARTAGFQVAELMSTLAGEPLYQRCGYRAAGEHVRHADVPLIRMQKYLLAQSDTAA